MAPGAGTSVPFTSTIRRLGEAPGGVPKAKKGGEHTAAGIVVDAEGVERRARGGGVHDAPTVGRVRGVCAGELDADPPTTEARAGDGFQVQGDTRYRARVHQLSDARSASAEGSGGIDLVVGSSTVVGSVEGHFGGIDLDANISQRTGCYEAANADDRAVDRELGLSSGAAQSS